MLITPPHPDGLIQEIHEEIVPAIRVVAAAGAVFGVVQGFRAKNDEERADAFATGAVSALVGVGTAAFSFFAMRRDAKRREQRRLVGPRA